MKKIFIVSILLASLFLHNSTFASRPYSVPCPFVGEVVSFKNKTQSINNIEKWELIIKIISHQTLNPKPKDYFYHTSPANLEKMCSFLDNQIISGTWYPPDQPYGKKQPDVDKTKVLMNGSIIKGEIDSFDHIIKNITLIKAATPVSQK